jgi:serine/threonine protein kinase
VSVIVASDDPLCGRTLGGFVVTSKLSEGGFGAIYLAEQPGLAREAVIKVIGAEQENTGNASARFLREAQLASRLDHPYAAHIYDFGVEPDGLLWIAMELVRGTPLNQILAAQGSLPLEEAVPLLEQICEVVYTAHEQGIIHRDLKPANVMVVSRAGRRIPKLLDFGLAKLVGEAPGADHLRPREPSSGDLTATAGHRGDVSTTVRTTGDASASTNASPTEEVTREGVVLGTPPYVAPELWTGATIADPRSDQYALGIMTFELLTGKRPFVASTVSALVHKHRNALPPSLGADFPPALDAVIATALAKDPQERHGSVLELSRALRTAAGLGDPAEAVPHLDPDTAGLLADTAQPLAEAAHAFGVARNVYQARDRALGLVHVIVRHVGVIALACHSKLAVRTGVSGEHALTLLRKLRRSRLEDEEWIALSRELCRAFVQKPEAHPMPELVWALYPPDGRSSSLDDLLAEAQALAKCEPSEVHLLPALSSFVQRIAAVIRDLSFVTEYALVVARAGVVERWMGPARVERDQVRLPGRPLPEGRPTLIDAIGRPVLTLWPVVQVATPAQGVAETLFYLDGDARRGARLLALPKDFERQDEEVWEWLRHELVDTVNSEMGARAEKSPYRGLSSFAADDAALFFGREREAEAFRNQLLVQPLMAVVGPSGAGKTSFVQAGVLPDLPAGWRVVILRPGPAPRARRAWSRPACPCAISCTIRRRSRSACAPRWPPRAPRSSWCSISSRNSSRCAATPTNSARSRRPPPGSHALPTTPSASW